MQIKLGDKLYIVARKDMLPGGTLAQSCHASFQFALDYPEITSQWMQQSNYICILEALDEAALHALIAEATKQEIKFSIFREPDMGDQITAITFAPGIESKKLCAKLKLALSNKGNIS